MVTNPKIERAQVLAERLQADFPIPEVSASTGHHFLFPNDKGFRSTIAAVADETPSASPGRMAVGITIGHGHIQSVLPETGVDLMVALDNDNLMVNWQRYMHQAVLARRTPWGYWRAMDSLASPVCEAIRDDAKDKAYHKIDYGHYVQGPWTYPVYPELWDEFRALGRRHFLSSPLRYRRCRQAQENTAFVFADASLSDRDMVSGLSYRLRSGDAEITYANFTNVHDYISREDVAHLGSLPFHDDALIAFSTTPYHMRYSTDFAQRIPTARTVHGFVGYHEAILENKSTIHESPTVSG